MNPAPRKDDRIRELFDRMLEQPAPERRAFIERECTADAGLRRELESLLGLHQAADEQLLEPRPAPGQRDTAQAARAAFATAARPVRDDSVLSAVERILGSAPRIALRAEDEVRSEPLIDPSTPERNPVPKLRGNYQVLGEIARGGMGVVLRGHDGDLGRDVALKVLHRELARDPAVLQRFVEEAQIGGQLQHPGVVPVYELGLMADERPFFTMKLIKGRTLASLLQERRTPMDERRRLLAIFESVCQTLAYAHARGVIHRDLKPANVMVGAFGEVQVVDWGLAKVLKHGGVADERRARRSDVSIISTVRNAPGSGGSNSLSGSVMGTPAYMSPEQARGEVEHVDERTDVFALGALLTEILTGEPPYVGAPRDILEMARECRTQAARERLAGCDADAELVALAERCLSKSPLDRPASAQVLADDLHAWAEGQAERVRAAEIEAAEAQVRAHEERKVRRLIVALAGVLALSGVGYGVYRAQHAERVRGVELLVQGALEDASLKRGQGDLAGALAAAERAAALVDAEELEGEIASRSAGHLTEARAAVAAAEKAAAEKARLDAFVALLERARSLQRGERLAEIEPLAVQRLRRSAPGRGPAIVEPHPGLEEEFLSLDSAWEGQPDTMLGARLMAYGQAFTLLGLDVDSEDSHALVERIRATGRAEEIALGLDGWALTLARQGKRDAPAARRRLQLADAVDPSELRARLRAMLTRKDVAGLAALASDAAIVREPPVTILMLAHALDASGAEGSTLPLLERGVEAHPSDFQLHAQLGLALSEAGPEQRSQALTHLTVARALNPTSISVLLALGEILREQGRAAAGLELLAEASALDPGNARAHVAHGDALQGEGRFVEALSEYQIATDLGGEDAALLLAMISCRLKSADVDGAIALCRRGAELFPEVGVWPLALADCHDAQQRPEEALAVLREAAGGELAVARALAGRLSEARRYRELVDEAEPWLERWPEDAGLLVAVANARGMLGQVEEGLRLFDRALAVAADPAQVRHRRSHMLVASGRRQLAIECLEAELESLASTPSNAPMIACSNERLALLLAQEPGGVEQVRAMRERALEILQARLRDDPSDQRRWTTVANLLSELGRHEQAAGLCRDGLKRFPADTDMRFVLVDCLVRTGRRDEALSEARLCREKHPPDAGACSGFGYLLAIALPPGQRDPREALAFVDLGLRTDPDSPYLLSVRGIALCQLGELDAGIADIERGLPNYAKRGDDPEQNGSISWDWIYLASACEARGRREDAVRAYEKALDLARRTDHPEEPLLVPMLEEVAQKLGLPAPELGGR